jgi:hypothetical protein
MRIDVTAQPLFDGTFSIDAVAAAAHSLVDQLHDEAIAAIAALAENWDQPVEHAPAVEDDEPVTYRDPESWSAADDEDDEVEIHLLQLADLPALLPRPAAVHVAPRAEQQPAGGLPEVFASAVTDEFAVPTEDDRQFVAV